MPTSFKQPLARIAALALAFVLGTSLLVLASCSSTTSGEKTPAQLNREYMSSVNSISSEAADALSDFSSAASDQDIAAMRLAAQKAEKAFDKLDDLDVPDVLSDVHKEYKDGASDLNEALSSYIEIYANVKAAGDDTDTATQAAAGIDDVKALYESGMKHLSDADDMVASLADDSSESETSASK